MIGCLIRFIQFFGIILIITVVGMFLKAGFPQNRQTTEINENDPKKEAEEERIALTNYAKESLCPQCKEPATKAAQRIEEDHRTTGTPPGDMPHHRLSLMDVKNLIHVSQFPHDKKLIRMGWEDTMVKQFFTLKPTAIAMEFTDQNTPTIEIFEPDSDKILVKGKKNNPIIKKILNLLKIYRIEPQMYVSQ